MPDADPPTAEPDAARAAPSRAAAAGLARDLTATLVVSLAALSFYVSSATLLFQGPLAEYLPLAIGATLLGSAVLSAFWAWRGSLPLASAGAEPATVPVLAAVTAGVAAQAAPAAVLPSALLALALTGLAIGGVWWWMGRRRWGDVIRYIPYPVIGGFIASVGWLMLAGGLGVSTGHPFRALETPAWLSAHADLRLASGVLIGVAIWWTTQRVTHVLALPGVIVLAALLVHAGLWAGGVGLDAARAQGWLLAPFSQTLPAWPGAPALWAAVDGVAVLQQSGLMLSAVIVATISLLLTDTSLEVAWDTRADLNRDLQALGQANVLAVAVGGLAGGVSISRSVLNRAAGATGRASGFMLAAVCLLALVWGGPAIALVPRPVLGGLLVFLGLGMLKTWLHDQRSRLPAGDRIAVWVMVLTTALAGFLPAVCVGVLVCCFDFAWASARQTPVRRRVARNAWPGRVERAPAESTHLQRAGERDLVIELQGALFFGSATALVREVDALLAASAPPVRLLFDFRQVRWLDTSAAQAIGRLFKQARQRGVQAELSALDASATRALQAAGVLGAGGSVVHADIDAAIAAWDDAALAAAQVEADTLEGWLATELPSPAMGAVLLARFDRVQLDQGERLFEQGDASDALFLVHSGRLVASVRTADGEQPVRTLHAGAPVGEMGLFRGVPRTATVRAVQPSTVLRLERAGLDALERESPALAAALYRLFLTRLSSRLDQSTAQAVALSR